MPKTHKIKLLKCDFRHNLHIYDSCKALLQSPNGQWMPFQINVIMKNAPIGSRNESFSNEYLSLWQHPSRVLSFFSSQGNKTKRDMFHSLTLKKWP